MDAKSPIDGNTGQTLLAVMQTDNTTGNAGNSTDRLLSWAMVQNLVFPQGGGYITPDSKVALPLEIDDKQAITATEAVGSGAFRTVNRHTRTERSPPQETPRTPLRSRFNTETSSTSAGSAGGAQLLSGMWWK